MKIIIPILILSLLSCNSTNSHHTDQIDSTEPKYIQEVIRDFNSINILDGVNKKEARVIANQYFWNYISNCGHTGEIIENQNRYSIKTHIGITGAESQKIITVTKNGGVSSGKDEPKFECLYTLKSDIIKKLKAKP